MKEQSRCNASNEAALEKYCDYDPIAIVGMACRWPGNISSTTALWDFLLEKGSGYCKVPEKSFNIDSFYHPEGERPGSISNQGGYFIQEDTRNFDPKFFGIAPSEAEEMDPQQRKLLEVCFECFESAGLTLDDVSNSQTSCYIANFTADMQTLQNKDPEYVSSLRTTGMGLTILSNRINYFFNLKGASLTLDTACSSSIYALHAACEALQTHECEAAIVGATNLVFTPEQQITSTKLGVLSPTSQCHTFDEAADGYARGEGVGALYVKRLSDAIKDKNVIRAVIRGTATNSNGRGTSITSPNSEDQERVIRAAYKRANLPLDDTHYFECHGTGTPTGDPAEVTALGRAFAGIRTAPLLIGSIKPNLGHAEAASGLAQIMKVVLSLENKMIPATTGIKKFNPKIDFRGANVVVVTETTPWPENGTLRRASINSFGYGGANAHVILEAIDSYLSQHAVYSPSRAATRIPAALTNGTLTQHTQKSQKPCLLVFSGHDRKALERRIHDIQAISAHFKPRDLAFTLSTNLTKFYYRAYIYSNLEGLKYELGEINYGKVAKTLLSIGFVFTGQGAQWPRMGCDLIEIFPSCRRTIRALDAVLKSLPAGEAPQWSLEEELSKPASSSRVHEVTRSQPLCTAVQIMLVLLLRSWNITPCSVLGHSSGEIAAAFTAGLLTEAEAIIVAYYRGLSVARYSTKNGRMLSVSMSQDEADELLRTNGHAESVSVACVNSPYSVTLSGDTDSIIQLKDYLESNNQFARILKTDRAYHSKAMLAVGDFYEEMCTNALSKVVPTCMNNKEQTDVIMVSSVYNCALGPNDSVGVKYWRENLESPVRFSAALQTLVDTSRTDQILEIGPHSVLAGPIRQVFSDISYLPTITRNKTNDPQATRSMLRLAGELWLKGYPVNLKRVNSEETLYYDENIGFENLTYGTGNRVIDLPPYKWSYDKLFWKESLASKQWRFRMHPRHDVLGSRVSGSSDTDPVWRNFLKASSLPWLADHLLEGKITFPAAGHICCAIEAITQIIELKNARLSSEEKIKIPGYELRYVSVKQALFIPDNGEKEIQVALKPLALNSVKVSGTTYEFRVSAFAEKTWIEHCCGQISIKSPAPSRNDGFNEMAFKHPQNVNQWFNKLESLGLTISSTFRGILELYTQPGAKLLQSCGRANIWHASKILEMQESRYVIHPTAIDNCMQLAIIAANHHAEFGPKRPYLPVLFDTIKVFPERFAGVSDAEIRAWGELRGLRSIYFNAQVLNDLGQPLLDMSDVKAVTLASKITTVSAAKKRLPFMRLLWKEDIAAMQPHDISNAISRLDHFSNIVAPGPPDSEVSTLCSTDLANLLNLQAHKNPAMSILQIGLTATGVCLAEELISSLDGDTPFALYALYTLADISQDRVNDAREAMNDKHRIDFQVFLGEKANNNNMLGQFDLLILTEAQPQDAVSATVYFTEMKKFLRPQGKILAFVAVPENVERSTLVTQWEGVFRESTYTCLNAFVLNSSSSSAVILASTSDASAREKSAQSCTIIYHGPTFEGTAHIAKVFERKGWEVFVSSLKDCIEIQRSTLYIFLTDFQSPLLYAMDSEDLSLMKLLVSKAKKLLWITASGWRKAVDPQRASTIGLIRSIRSEYPFLELYSLQMTPHVHIDEWAHKVTVIETLADRLLDHIPGTVDAEYAEKDGTLFIPRVRVDKSLNRCYNQGLSGQLAERSFPRQGEIQLDMGQAGVLSTLYFKKSKLDSALLGDFELLLEVKAISLNAKDMTVYIGLFDSKGQTTSTEYSGIVKQVGAKVTRFKIGDRCAAMVSAVFGTTIKVPERNAITVPASDTSTFEKLATLPVAYGSALYGLKYLCRLQQDETVLITSAAGGAGIAAIEIARILGAEIFVTVGSEHKRRFLKESFGIPDDHMFYSRDSSFVEKIMDATGRGVDVICNTTMGEVLHETWKCIAPFGRFIEINRRDVLDNARLDMTVFNRNVSFHSYDLGDFTIARNPSLPELLADVSALYKQEKIGRIMPITVYPVTQIEAAVRFFMSGKHCGKVVFTLDREQAGLIKYQPTPPSVVLRPDATYFLVGCLGGIGRVFVPYMVAKGARNFVFLSRSGASKPEASHLIENMRAAGIRADVIQGDAGNFGVVADAVLSIPKERPIRGVVTAAMVEKDGPFDALNIQNLDSVIRPKLQAALNLHNVLMHESLDFFVMTSSLSNALGVPLQSSYAAANAGLDDLAQGRRKEGLPAVSLALGAVGGVGFLHEHGGHDRFRQFFPGKDVEIDELLPLFDYGLRNGHVGEQSDMDVCKEYHDDPYVLSGLEVTSRPQDSRELPFWAHDLKFASVLSALKDATGKDVTATVEDSGVVNKVNALLAQDETLAIEYLSTCICGKVAEMIGWDLDRLDYSKSLAAYGMASLTGVELRAWFAKELKVGLTFSELLEPTQSIKKLAALVIDRRKYDIKK